MQRGLYPWRRATIVTALVVLGSLCMFVSAQQANFTGTVRSVDASNIRAVRFQYDAGARSYWHIHDGSQILVLEQGRGRVQVQGQPLREMVPQQPVFLPGGVAHWHGAAPNEGLTQIAVNLGGVKWLQEVTDKEYLAEIKR